MIKNAIEQILNEINSNNVFNLSNVNLKELTRAVREEGVSNKSSHQMIKDVILDLFDSVGYDEFGIVDTE
jgi:hypothetical protein